MHFTRAALFVVACLGLGLLAGCSAETTGSSTSDEFKPLLEPFTAPPLAEIDASAEWVDQPVLDALELLRKKQAAETPAATTAEALELRNTSPEANAKIVSALGRLPEKDADVDWDATMNAYIEFDVGTLNPILAQSAAEAEVQSLISVGLLGFDWTMTPFGSADVLKSWQTSKDRMMDKFVLRDDLTWSDGKPITAHDVAFTFKTIMDPRVPVPAVRNGTDKLRWVEAYDDHTLVMFHKEALATNVWNMMFSIVPRHIYEASLREDPTMKDSPTHVKYESQPVTGGPYEVTQRKHGQEIVLARREGWYMHDGKQVRQRPYIKTIRMRVMQDPNTILLALKRGDLDLAILTPPQWTTQTDDDAFYRLNTKSTGPEWTFFYFGWNMTTPWFQDVRVRKAMSYAMSYDEMLNKTLYGLYRQCTGIFDPDSWMAPKPPLPFYKQDLNKAEQLLDEAGWIDHDDDGIRDKEIDGKLVPFEFTMLCSNVPERVAICTLMKECLDQIGVVCHIRALESTVLMQRMLEKDFQAQFAGWGAGADPDTSENIWGTGEQRNYVSYSSPEVDRLFKEGRLEFDRDKRAAMYGEIARLISEDQPYTFLYLRSSFYGFNKQLRGYNYSPRGPFTYSPGIGSLWRETP